MNTDKSTITVNTFYRMSKDEQNYWINNHSTLENIETNLWLLTKLLTFEKQMIKKYG